MYISLFLLSKQFMFIRKNVLSIFAELTRFSVCENNKSDFLVLCINMYYFTRKRTIEFTVFY